MKEKRITNKGRYVTSVWIDRDIHRAFIEKCRKTGQSTCHVLEAFEYAFAKALPDTPITTLPKIEVNLTVNRVVERVHRITRPRTWNGGMIYSDGKVRYD